jgi:AcrR family transcriptional regulator
MSAASPADRARQKVAAIRARDLRARRSMQELHNALLALIEERPFDGITIDDIVEKSGVGRSTFYRHYATKEALIEEIAKTEIEQLVDLTFPLTSRSDSRPSCLALARYVDARRKLWRILLTGGAAGVMRESFAKLAMEKGPKNLDTTDMDIPIDLGAVWGVAATVEIIAWWLRQSKPVSIEKIAEYLDRLAVRPAFSPGD